MATATKALERAPRRRQEERSAEATQRMTDAAVELLVEHGIRGTTLAAIGERAGYSRGLVTHHFGSKGGLLAHVHDAIAERWVRRVTRAGGTATGLEALLRVTDALLAFMVEEPAGLRAMYLLRYASIDPGAKYRTNVAALNREHISVLTDIVRRGQRDGDIPAAHDPRVAAELFASAVDGLLYRWLVTPELPAHAVHAMFRAAIEKACTP
jgi:AcrR family transcriptional regulator